MVENLYILGAGASVDAGAAVMNNFIDTVEDLLISKKFRDNQKFNSLFESIKSLNRIHAKSNLDLDNVENVLGLLEMAELLKYPLSDNSSFQSLKDVYIEMMSETIELSMKYKISDPKTITPLGTYQSFINNLQSNSKNSAIITFNYDLGIDVALYNARIPYNYYLKIEDRAFPLLKLHGSLNWFETKDNKVAHYDLNTFFTYQAFPFPIDVVERHGILSFSKFVEN